jgi:DNA-binding CsgD family transcriptional regulator
MIGDRAMASAALSLLSWSSYTTADLDAAVRYCTSAARLFDGLSDGELSARIDTTAWLCHAERFVDRFDDALRHTDRCIALARATGRSHVLTYLLSHRAMVLRWLGRFPEAAQAAEDGAEVALLMDSGPLQEVALQTGNRIRLAAGGTGHVDQVLDALGGPELPGLDRLSRPIKYEELARADVAAGHFARAEKWAYSAEFTAHPALPTRIGAADLAWAHVLLAGDRPAEARVRAQSSVAAFEVRGNRFDVGRAYLVWGRASAALGETADAISRLEQAETVFTECGVPGLAAQAARDLRSLGRRATGGAELTARERQIAELVADGSSNREIAEVLVISERTVGTHLSRIYAKLGISSRAALAAERARGR